MSGTKSSALRIVAMSTGLLFVVALVLMLANQVTGPIDVIGDADVGVVEENLEEAARKALSKSPEACRRFAEQFA